MESTRTRQENQRTEMIFTIKRQNDIPRETIPSFYLKEYWSTAITFQEFEPFPKNGITRISVICSKMEAHMSNEAIKKLKYQNIPSTVCEMLREMSRIQSIKTLFSNDSRITSKMPRVLSCYQHSQKQPCTQSNVARWKYVDYRELRTYPDVTGEIF